jgi:hypothetical protein
MFTGTPDITAFNNVFVERLGTQEGLDKTASAAMAFVRARMREIAFSRRILPPEIVTRADCQRHTRHDTLIKIVDIEPNSKAMAVNFRGQATDHYVQGARYSIPFFKIESEKFAKSEAELLAYDYPITKVIEENSIKDLQYVEDMKFIEYCESAINVSSKRLVSPDTSVNRKNLTKLFKMIDFDKLSVGCVLMSTVDWDDWMVQPATDIGSPLASEMTFAGYKYDTILKRRLVVTNKCDIVLPGHIYAFTEPAYLGNFFILNDTKFWIKKEADTIFWKTWEYIGEGIGNVRAVAKLELDVEAPIPVSSI